MAENPFSYGSPVRAEHFTDRRVEVADIADRMLNGQNVILLSPRRYGKTSVLYAAMERARRRGGRTGYASLAQCTDRRDVAAELLRAALSGPLSWIASRTADLGRLLGRLRIQPEVSARPDGSIGVRISPGMGVETTTDVVGEILRLLGDAGEGRHPVSLVIDEFQQVEEIPELDGGVFKSLADELTHVSLVFSGSREHIMRRLTTGAGAPLLGMGEPFNLDKVPRADMLRYVGARCRDGAHPIDPGAAALLFDLVDGIPNDVQRLAYTTFSLANGPIAEATVREGMRRAVLHQSADFTERYEQLAPTQKRLLRALAREPREAVYARPFLDEVGVANQNSVRHGLGRLAGAELLVRRGRVWEVSNPFLRAWLLESPGLAAAP